MGSSPAAGATATDAAMPLSPPTDDGDDETTKTRARDDATRGGGGRRQGTRAVGGRRKAREWRVMKAQQDGGGLRRR